MVSIVCQISIQKSHHFLGEIPKKKSPEFSPKNSDLSIPPVLVQIRHRNWDGLSEFITNRFFFSVIFHKPNGSPRNGRRIHRSITATRKKKHRERPRRPWNLWIYLFPAQRTTKLEAKRSIWIQLNFAWCRNWKSLNPDFFWSTSWVSDLGPGMKNSPGHFRNANPLGYQKFGDQPVTHTWRTWHC